MGGVAASKGAAAAGVAVTAASAGTVADAALRKSRREQYT